MVWFRDAHFVIGGEDEKKTEEDDNIISDPKYVAFFQPIAMCKLKLQNRSEYGLPLSSRGRGPWWLWWLSTISIT